MFLSPGVNILEAPEVELPPPKMSTALPASFHQTISLLQNLVHLVIMHRDGDSEKFLESWVNLIPQAWTVLAELTAV